MMKNFKGDHKIHTYLRYKYQVFWNTEFTFCDEWQKSDFSQGPVMNYVWETSFHVLCVQYKGSSPEVKGWKENKRRELSAVTTLETSVPGGQWGSVASTIPFQMETCVFPTVPC